MTPELLAGLMFLAVVVIIFSGLPVAFVLGGIALAFGIAGILLDYISVAQLTNIVPRIFGSAVASNVLVAVPLFIFMGSLLEKTEIANNLMTSLGTLLRRVPGGQAVAVVIIGTVMAATTGIVGASVVMLSMMALPVLRKAGYRERLSYGAIAASGTLGILIPPSIMLVILGDQVQVPVGALFAAALWPGLILAGLYVIYIIIASMVRPSIAPPLKVQVNEAGASSARRDFLLGLVPPAFLIFSVLGSILLGYASPTEAAGIGVLAVLLLGLVYRRMSGKVFFSAVEQSASTNALVFFIIFGATAFSYVFRMLDGEYFVIDLLQGLGIETVQETVLLVMVLVFLLGFFFDFIEVSLIVLPVFIPVLSALNIVELFGSAQVFWLWFAMLVSLNLQTSFLTPPFGFSLFYMQGTDPKGIRLSDVYLGVIPFIMLQLTLLVAVYFLPEIALHLPLSLGLAE